MGVCLRVFFFPRLRQAALVVQQHQMTHTTARKVELHMCVCVPSREADKQVQHTLFLMP